jgi:hypothetical protein
MRIRSLACVCAAAMFLSTTAPARAAGVLPALATPVQREQAQSRFLRGKDFLAKKRYDDALVEFRASHEIVASPNTRLEIARCLRQMGKTVAAYAELGRAQVEAKELVAQDNRYQRAYDAAASERADIEPQLGFVTMTIQNAADDSKVTVDGEEIRRAAWGEPAPVAAGGTEIVVETPCRAPVRRTVTLTAVQRLQVTIDAQSVEEAPAPAAPTPAPHPEQTSGTNSTRTWAYVVGGVGAAGMVTFAIFGAMAKSTYDDLDAACHGGPCPAGKSDEISSGKTQETVANVALGVGIVGLAAGAALFVFGKPQSAHPPAAAVLVGPGWMGMKGSW